MILPGSDRQAAPVVVGSHLDSVARGGNYDGAAGVVSGVIGSDAGDWSDSLPVSLVAVHETEKAVPKFIEDSGTSMLTVALLCGMLVVEWSPHVYFEIRGNVSV